MGKFSGYLICSDLDGTFGGTDCEAENSRAVQYFIENGGKFTFASGRTADFFRAKDYFSLINAPACLFNGGVIYDYRSEQLLRETRVGFTVEEFLDAIRDKRDLIRELCLYPDTAGEILRFKELCSIEGKYLNQRSVKVLCVFDNPEKANEFKAFALAHSFFKDSYISKSWGVGVEFNAASATKGHALKFIKESLGNIHTSIGIGDYENDMMLLKFADIGVAVGDGVEELKQIADWVVKPHREAALKDLIEKLEMRL